MYISVTASELSRFLPERPFGSNEKLSSEKESRLLPVRIAAFWQTTLDVRECLHRCLTPIG